VIRAQPHSITSECKELADHKEAQQFGPGVVVKRFQDARSRIVMNLSMK
jgi:hypothetical protein